MRSVAYLAILGCSVLACGGRTEDSVSDSTATAGGTGSSTGAANGGTNAIGETGGAAAGGYAGAEACTSGTVTLTVVPPAGSETHWCLGTPGGCAYGANTLSDADGPLSLSNLCSFDCGSCQLALCPPIVCLSAQALNAPVKLLVWDGTYYERGTRFCAGGASCVTRRCAPRGFYSYTFVAYVNPAPDAPDGCARATSDTPVTSATASFLYPDQTDITLGI